MKYLITGGSGFLGKTLIQRLKELGEIDVRVVARNEGNLVSLKEQFPFIEIITGNISDKFTCAKACDGVSGIFHLAAYKHVGLAEQNVSECINSNVVGTINLLEETRTNKSDFIIGISTDKAARVSGVYGATKLLQERLFAEYELLNRDTKYRTVRYGNVLYSTGSVVCKWKERLLRGDEIIITEPKATRFYWTVDESVDLIFECLNNAIDSTPMSRPMKSIMLGDLLDAMIEKYAVKKPDIKVIGLQQGENLHEIITPDGKDSSMVERFTKEEILGLI